MGVGGLYLVLYALCFAMVGVIGAVAAALCIYGRRQERRGRARRLPGGSGVDENLKGR